jgi:hypothetical protein
MVLYPFGLVVYDFLVFPNLRGLEIFYLIDKDDGKMILGRCRNEPQNRRTDVLAPSKVVRHFRQMIHHLRHTNHRLRYPSFSPEFQGCRSTQTNLAGFSTCQ